MGNSKKFIAQLKDCPYCGGRPEIKNVKLIGKHVMQGKRKNKSCRVYYVRCSNCHAKTQDFAFYDNLFNMWNRGNIYHA